MKKPTSTKGKPKEGTTKTLTLHFDTKVGRENFIAWYLQSGEQQAGYFTDGRLGKNWMHVKPGHGACPKCEYPLEDKVRGFLYEKKKYPYILNTCMNCDHEYRLDNPYYEKG